MTAIVDNFYNENYKKFSDTRFCLWDVVRDFGNNFTSSSIVLDAGCGNGKNMIYALKNNKFVIGIDNCNKLLDICKNKELKVFKADCCYLQFLSNSMDYIFSIAVFHHLATKERRELAFIEAVRVLKPGKEGLISLWSVENQKKRNFKAGDNYVKWERRIDKKKFERYYYIYNRKMVYEYIKCVEGLIQVLDIYNEMGNWVMWFKKI